MYPKRKFRYNGKPNQLGFQHWTSNCSWAWNYPPKSVWYDRVCWSDLGKLCRNPSTYKSLRWINLAMPVPKHLLSLTYFCVFLHFPPFALFWQGGAMESLCKFTVLRALGWSTALRGHTGGAASLPHAVWDVSYRGHKRRHKAGPPGCSNSFDQSQSISLNNR